MHETSEGPKQQLLKIRMPGFSIDDLIGLWACLETISRVPEKQHGVSMAHIYTPKPLRS